MDILFWYLLFKSTYWNIRDFESFIFRLSEPSTRVWQFSMYESTHDALYVLLIWCVIFSNSKDIIWIKRIWSVRSGLSLLSYDLYNNMSHSRIEPSPKVGRRLNSRLPVRDGVSYGKHVRNLLLPVSKVLFYFLQNYIQRSKFQVLSI